MKTRANKSDVESLIKTAEAKGWTKDEQKEYLKSGALWWHAVTLKSPMNRWGDWATIMIINPDCHPRLETRTSYARKSEKGLFHARYVLSEFKPETQTTNQA